MRIDDIKEALNEIREKVDGHSCEGCHECRDALFDLVNLVVELARRHADG